MWRRGAAGLQFELQPGWKTYWRSPGDAGFPVTSIGPDRPILPGAIFPGRCRTASCCSGSTLLAMRMRSSFPSRRRPRPEASGATPQGRLSPLREDLHSLHGPSLPRSPGGRRRTHATSPNSSIALPASVPGDGAAHGLKLIVRRRRGRSIGAASDRFRRFRFSLRPSRSDRRGAERALFSGTPVTPRLRRPACLVRYCRPARCEGAASCRNAAGPDRHRRGRADWKRECCRRRRSGSPLWPALLAALLGGLILNLMPCVLPVLSLKLLAFVGHGGANAVDRPPQLPCQHRRCAGELPRSGGGGGRAEAPRAWPSAGACSSSSPISLSAWRCC